MSIKQQIKDLKKLITLPWIIQMVNSFVPKEERKEKVVYVHIDLEDKE